MILPETIAEAGIQKISAAFCYPVEISHGYMYDLLQKEPDYIFLPHVRGLYVENGPESSILCPMAQGEPYYLKASWERLEASDVFTPVLDFKDGLQSMQEKICDYWPATGK